MVNAWVNHDNSKSCVLKKKESRCNAGNAWHSPSVQTGQEWPDNAGDCWPQQLFFASELASPTARRLICANITSAKAIVNVDHGHPFGAGIEHSQQRQTLKRSAIADRGGNRDDRIGHQPSRTPRPPPCRQSQSVLGAAQFIQVGKQPMNASHTDVIAAEHTTA